jgi:gluconolactonase
MLYVCESAFARVLRFTVEPDGRLTNKEIFVELLGGDPDGIAFDSEGNLYVAHYGGGAVYVIAPDGRIKQKIPTPGKKPTNLEFADEDLQTLFLTEVETNALYKRRVDIAGLKLY